VSDKYVNKKKVMKTIKVTVRCKYVYMIIFGAMCKDKSGTPTKDLNLLLQHSRIITKFEY